MALVDIEKGVQAAKALVQQAHQEGRLQQLTNRIVRKEVEKQLELEEGVLEEKEYKKQLNDAVKEAVDSLAEAAEHGEATSKIDTIVKAKANPKNRKSDAKATPPSSSKAPEYSASTKAEKPKKSEAAGKVKASAKAAPASKGEKPKKAKAKSKETVGDEESSPTKPSEESAKLKSETKVKKRQVQLDDEVEEESAASPPKKKKKAEVLDSPVKSKKTRSKKGEDKDATKAELSEEKKPDVVSLAASGGDDAALIDDGDKSESEMSSLIDEEPAKKKRRGKSEEKKPKGASKGKKRPTKEKKGSTAKEESPEEEQLKRLKSLVFACGIRKVWSKELKDIETTAKQIGHVRNILVDLGMKGRFSLEQARAIKERREFQQELEEVREFAAKHAGEGRPKRAAANASKPVVSADTDSEEESENDEDAGPSRRAKNARQSIMAFLQDQSDSE